MAIPVSSSVAPAAQEYGGDEVSALILDPGSSTVRAGFAGEDVPKSVIPSHYANVLDKHAPDGRKNIYGENSIYYPTPDVDIRNPMADDGTVGDWDSAEKLWEAAITSRLVNPKANKPNDYWKGKNGENGDDVEMEDAEEEEKLLEENPLLMTETGWNAGKNREKGIEVAIESYGAPAFWQSRSGPLAAYSAGKPTALVIDIGHNSSSVTPIHDGLQLRKGTIRSPLGASFLQLQARHIIASKPAPTIDLIPFHSIASKTYSEHPNPPQYSLRPTKDPPPRESFTRLQENRLLASFNENVAQVWPGPTPLSAANSLNPPGHGIDTAGILKAATVRNYEFPTGLAVPFSAQERASITERLFDAKAPVGSVGVSNFSPSTPTIPEMVKQSVDACDVDIKPALMANIVVVGGGSLLYGMTERIQNEIAQIWPGAKIRVYASGVSVERKYASWVGGSILASLGTFHQMWISRKEYEENGPGIVEKRCK